jgi:hypothetical protein
MISGSQGKNIEADRNARLRGRCWLAVAARTTSSVGYQPREVAGEMLVPGLRRQRDFEEPDGLLPCLTFKSSGRVLVAADSVASCGAWRGRIPTRSAVPGRFCLLL